MAIIKEDETLEDLLIDGLKIIQSKSLYRFSSDAVLLSKFASYKKGDVVADFCSGSGIVGLHFYALHRGVSRVDEYEIQSALADMCGRSIEYNGIKTVFSYNIPIQQIPKEYNGKYTLILCNPPYKKSGGGEVNATDSVAIARHEITVTLEEIIDTAAKKLAPKGRFCMCQRTERLTDVLCLMRENGLEPVRLQFIKGADKAPYLFMVEGVKGVKPQLKILSDIGN